jgi:FAD/FMN-containing dehydrogenase/Fe-S oxidoreductase
VHADPATLPEIATDLATRTVYATDNSIYQVLPAGVATPASADEVAALLSENHRSSAPRPVVARGGGTGTNGQSLTDGIVVDLKRSLNRIVSIDVDARSAVVEPGVVAGALNARLAAHGLMWAPHTSTLNRATVGGMVATDAAGKGSLVHGRAHRHVTALDLCLADGSIVHLEPTPLAEAERQASREDAVGRLWRSLLDLPIAQGEHFDLPELARGFSGYGIDRFRRDGLIDPVALVVGAEGTLGVVTRAWLRLTSVPAHTAMVVAVYDTFEQALGDSVRLMSSGPTAIEAFDETTLLAARRSAAWSAFDDVVGDLPGAVLILEYASDGVDVESIVGTITGHGDVRAVAAIHEASRRRDVWKVRADAVGLLAARSTGGPERSERPTAMVEDCAVPVDRLGEFIGEFRALLDAAGVEYGMFGHADVGCVHVRPALDTTDPEHERLVSELTDAVVELVSRHGGILWGEHGRGFRGDCADRFLTQPTIEVMERVKAAFDPDDLCNPGKLYRPFGSDRALVAVDEPVLRGQVNRSVAVAVRNEQESAFACNGNGLCHDHDPAAPMCPSFKATGNPALSPKGRADLYRAWLAAPVGEAAHGELTDALAENLHECLSCSACSGQCPVRVDIPELKSRFLEDYHRNHRRPVAHHVMSRFERLAPLVARAPWLVRRVIRLTERLLGLVDLPVPPGRTGRTLPEFSTTGDADVVILRDVFTSVLEPQVLDAAFDALVASGYRVAVARLVPSGKFDHVKGRRSRFVRAASRQRRLVEQVMATGAVATVLEPAVELLHGHEYPMVDAHHPSGAVVSFVDLLDRAPRPLPTVADPRDIALFGHCTEQALAPGRRATWKRVLESVGHRVSVVDSGCCGMAGVFGHERGNQEMSRRLWDLGWVPSIESGGSVERCATGASCRSQAGRFGGDAMLHPVLHLA